MYITMALRGFGHQVAVHVKISQLVNKMCSQQACRKLVATALSLTTC